MFSNQNKGHYSLNVKEFPLHSEESKEMQQKIKNSIVNIHSTFETEWDLKRAFSINNDIFTRQFNEKRTEIQTNSPVFAHREIRYGFLTTIKESVIHKVADEGLEVKLCPYNYFGHNISGIHISQNADVCMNEADSKIKPDEEIILITFKYMLGKHKIVPMYDQDILLAPTPNFDSHLCEERPDPIEKIGNQYIKSLVYLYEFENDQLDPTIRPRHCCPVSALVYKHAKPIFFENNLAASWNSKCDTDTYSFLKPIEQKHWGREFLLAGSSNDFEPPTIKRNERDETRRPVMPNYKDRLPDERSLKFMDRIERPIQRQYGAVIDQDSREAVLPNYSDRIPDERSLKFMDRIERPIQRQYGAVIGQDSREAILPNYSDRIPDERSLKFMDHNIDHRDQLRRQIDRRITQDDRERSNEVEGSRSRRDINNESLSKPLYLERDRSFDRLQQCKEDARIRERPREINEYSSAAFKPKEHMSSLRTWFQ